MTDDFSDDEDTEEATAARIARHANNTPADDRLMAMRVLRAVVDNPGAKPSDRAAAAVQLLKAVNEAAGVQDDAQLQAYDLTDEQLLEVIRVAQAERQNLEPGKQQNLEILPPHPAKSTPVTTSDNVPRETPRPSFLDALASIPDIDPLCL